jgi:hypothetical protein
VQWRTSGVIDVPECDPVNASGRQKPLLWPCHSVRRRVPKGSPVNLQPEPVNTQVGNVSGTVRGIVAITLLVLAAVAILVVLDVLPRSILSQMSLKAVLVGGICLVTSIALGLLAKK